MSLASRQPIAELEAFDPETGDLNVVIETPAGSRNKFKYDPAHGLFKLNAVLPDGAVFPYDFGFIPATRGQDGDPLDVLVLMDQGAFTGCLLQARLIGVIEVQQTEKGGVPERNDRLIAVACASHDHRDVLRLNQVSPNLLREIEHFFGAYNAIRGKRFKPLGRHGPKRAMKLVEEGRQRGGKGEEGHS
jgi:inorganic pyrophosphatase